MGRASSFTPNQPGCRMRQITQQATTVGAVQPLRHRAGKKLARETHHEVWLALLSYSAVPAFDYLSMPHGHATATRAARVLFPGGS